MIWSEDNVKAQVLGTYISFTCNRLIPEFGNRH